MTKANYGSVEFQGKTLVLTQEAYAANYGTDGEVRYYAVATDDKGNEYEIVWENTELWNLATELATLESRQELMDSKDAQRLAELSKQVNSSYCEDEANACDWESPIEANEI